VRIIRTGDVGEDVRDVQRRLLALGGAIDPEELEGSFGPSSDAAVRAFQAGRRLPVDGLVGPDTWAQLVEAGYSLGDRVLYLRHPFQRGDDVRELQRWLNALGFDTGREDGILGKETDRAIREFQRNVGREIDGIVGPDTIAALDRLRPDVEAPSRAVVREAEGLRTQRGSVHGAIVAIDPGHGPGAGLRGPTGLLESTVTYRVAELLRARLEQLGAHPALLRDTQSESTPSERASLANAAGADLCVSIHLGSEGPQDEGPVYAYFGTGRTHSPAGQRLAQLIQAAMRDRLGFADDGTQRLAITILRETKMPAVAVKPCDLANPDAEARLLDPAFLAGIAGSLADAIEEFLVGDGGELAPAGAWRARSRPNQATGGSARSVSTGRSTTGEPPRRSSRG
jgi:N-acetylmuramoyl-L-alanine amidase